jgi:hypothetical protein
MAHIGVWIKRNRGKKDHARLPEHVGGLHRYLQRRVVEGPLRTLHPVDHALSIRIRGAFAPDIHARVIGKFLKFVHGEY